MLFCDIVGSTRLAESLDPEVLNRVTRDYYDYCAAAIRRFDGIIANYMGDGVMALFGYPHAHEDDAERAIHAALSVVRTLDTSGGSTKMCVRVRIGIATGVVVVGEDGTGALTKEKAVVGEAPNFAAHLQAAAKPNTVLISAATRGLVGDVFVLEELKLRNMKGARGEVTAWRVIDEKVAPSRFAAHVISLTKFVGRDDEVGLLLDRWERASRESGQVVLLAGEAGIGKSRIAETFHQLIAESPRAVRRYQCSPYYIDSALYPVISQIEQAAGLDVRDRPWLKLEKLEAFLKRSSARPDELIPLFAALLSTPVGDRYPPADPDPQVRKERTLHALLDELEGLTLEAPLLIMLEDAHWADPTTIELFSRLIVRIPEMRILLIVTHRPDCTLPWVSQSHITALLLNRLERHQCHDLVESIARHKALPAEVMDQILAKSDGVPLFVEELTKTVLESGLLREQEAAWALAGPLPPVAIPTTLRDSLVARLDRLAAVKEVAQIGAAIGREFTCDLLAAVSGLRELDLWDALDKLAAAELVFSRGMPPTASYVFKHALVQEAAYESLLKSRRQQLHAQIAKVLETRFPEVAETQPEVVAHHYTRAVLTEVVAESWSEAAAHAIGGLDDPKTVRLIEKATGYWGRAGRKSIAQSAMVEATSHFRKGLDLLATLPASVQRWRLELDLQCGLSAALLASRGHGAPEVGEVYARARVLGELLGDAEALVPILGGQFSFHLQRGEYAAGRRIAETLLRLADKQNQPASRVVGHRAMGVCMHQVGAFASAAAHFERVLDLYLPELHQSIGAVAGFDPRAAALRYLAFGQFIRGHPDRAMSSMTKMMRWSEMLGHPYIMVHALNWASSFHLLRGNPEAALDPLQKLFALTEPRFPLWLALGQINRGLLLAESGEQAEGLALGRKGFAAMMAIGSTWNQTYYRGLLAQICEYAAQPDEAMDELATALSIAEETSERWFEPELHRLMGEWLLCHRPAARADAEARFRRAIGVAQEQEAKTWELRATMSLSRLWRDDGKHSEALALLAPLYGWFTEGIDLPDLRAARTLLRQLPDRLSDGSRAAPATIHASAVLSGEVSQIQQE